jgi:hypothetical protein
MNRLNMFINESIKDWLEEIIETKPVSYNRPDMAQPINLYVHHNKLAKIGHYELSHHLKRMNKFQVAYLITLIKGIEEGPKIICPAFEECLALEQVEIRVPLSEYQQPFPVVFVEFPYKYYEHLKNKTGRIAPKGAIVFHEPDCCFISIHIIYKTNDFEDISAFLDSNAQHETIEDSLNDLVNNDVMDEDVKLAKVVERVLLNLNMVLVSEGYRQTIVVEKYKNKAKKIVDRPITLIGFDQHIKLYERKTMKTVIAGDGTHKSPHPHWRRGHYRQQPYGENKSKRKRIFVKPVFVCSDSFAGDLSMTSVEYQVGRHNA